MSHPSGDLLRQYYARYHGHSQTRLAPADFDTAWAEGQHMMLRQVMADIAAM
jgi:hypothetical protein